MYRYICVMYRYMCVFYDMCAMYRYMCYVRYVCAMYGICGYVPVCVMYGVCVLCTGICVLCTGICVLCTGICVLCTGICVLWISICLFLQFLYWILELIKTVWYFLLFNLFCYCSSMKRTYISFTEYYQCNGGFCVNIIRLLCCLCHKWIDNAVRSQ